MIALTPDELRGHRLQRQYLAPRAESGAVGEVVGSVCGINAQRTSAMDLALRARVGGLTMEDLRGALNNHTFVRTWAMRSTLHLLAAGDLRWMVSLLGPTLLPRGEARRRALGLDLKTLELARVALPEILDGGVSLTRYELAEALAVRGIHIEASGQAPIHLIGYAALSGLVCLALDRENGEPTYTLVNEWVPPSPALSRDMALMNLARRYLAGYGPATVRDLAAWSGLTLGEAREGWELALAEGGMTGVGVQGESFSILSRDETSGRLPTSEPIVNLLPAFDTYLLGYADRAKVVPLEYHREIYHGGQVVPTVLVNGTAAGVWRHTSRGRSIEITVRPFRPLSRPIRRLVEGEAEDIARFMKRSLRLTIEK